MTLNALRGRQPTSLIAFILFVLCCFNLFCRYLSKYDSKKRKKLSLGSPEPWHDPCLQWHGRATLCHNQPSIFQKVGTTRANIGTAVRDYWVAINQDFLFFFPHSITTTSLLLKPLSKTSITTYLQIFTTTPNLHKNTKFIHPITSKHHSST